MKVEIEIKLDPELQALVGRLVEALRDLSTVVAPLTGYRVLAEDDDD